MNSADTIGDLHTIVETIAAVITFAGFVILLMIKNNQAEVKADLTAQMSKTSQDIAVHSGRDEEKFDSIDATLTRLDNNGGRMEGKIDVLMKPQAKRTRAKRK